MKKLKSRRKLSLTLHEIKPLTTLEVVTGGYIIAISGYCTNVLDPRLAPKLDTNVLSEIKGCASLLC